MKPWEKYAEQKPGKPWEKYAAERKPDVVKKSDPTEGMTTGEKLLVGFGKGVVDTGRGVKQLLNIGDQDQLRKEIAESRELDKPLTDTTAGTIGNVAGNIAATAPAMLIPGANTILGGAAIGAGMGALTPTVSDSEIPVNLAGGAAGGGLGVALGRAIPSLSSAFIAPFTEKGRERIAGNVLRESVGDDVTAAIAKLSNPEIFVPGSTPNIAEVLMNPKTATLLKGVRNLPDGKEAVFSQEVKSNAARLAAIRSIAQDDAAIEAAKLARKEATKSDYEAIHNQFIQSNPELERILATPSGQNAVSNARTLAGNEYRQFGEPVPGMYPKESSISTLPAENVGNADHWTKQPINLDKDNLLTAVRKMGGINKEMAQSTYGNRMWEDGLGHGLFRNNGGQSLDDLAARLSEHGYLPEGSGPYELTEALYGKNADTIFSNAKNSYDDVFRPEETANDALHSQLKRVADALEAKNQPKKSALNAEKSPYDIAYYGKDLHNIQRSLKDMATNPNSDPVLKHSISSLLDDYVGQLEKNVPGLLDVNKKYASLSAPINQMEIGQALKNKLVPALTEKGLPTRERANMFAEAIRNQQATIKKATGARNKSLEDVMTPEQMQVITGISKDLERKAGANDLAAARGSDTAQNMITDNLLRNIVGPIGMPDSWMSKVVASSLVNALPRRAVDAVIPGVERKVQGVLADAMTNPEMAARLLSSADKKNEIARILASMLPSLGAQSALSSN